MIDLKSKGFGLGLPLIVGGKPARLASVLSKRRTADQGPPDKGSPAPGQEPRCRITIPREDQFLIVAFLSLIVLPVMYLLRAFDNNTLTSWNWIYAHGTILKPFGFVLAGTAVAFCVKNLVPDRFTGLFLFVLAFASVVPLWSEPEGILDASRYFLEAKHLELYGMSSFIRKWGTGGLPAWTDLPIVPFLYGFIFRVFGESRLFIQVFTTLLFALTVVLTSLIGSRVWDRETGRDAGLLLLGSPYLLAQVPLMLVDVPAMFFVTLAVFAFLRALAGWGFWIFFASAALVTAVFCKYSAGLMLLVLPLIAALAWRQGQEKVFLRSFCILVPAALIISLIILSRYALLKEQIGLLRSYQLPGLSRWNESLVSTFCFQVHPFITVLALVGVFRSIRNKDATFLIPAWFGVFGSQVERIRYILPLFPFLAMAAGYGLGAVRDKALRIFISLSIVAASLALAFGSYLPFLQSTNMANLMDAGIFLHSLPGDCVLVRTLPQSGSTGNTRMAVPLLDLSTGKKLLYQPGSAVLPDRGTLRQSLLRFTWEYPLPSFYLSDATGSRQCPLALISSSPAPEDPALLTSVPENRSSRRFIKDTGTFRFKTFVTIYREGLSQTGQEGLLSVPFGTDKN